MACASEQLSPRTILALVLVALVGFVDGRTCTDCFMYPNRCAAGLLVSSNTESTVIPDCTSGSSIAACCGLPPTPNCTLSNSAPCSSIYQSRCASGTVNVLTQPQSACAAGCPSNYHQELPYTSFCVGDNCAVVSGADCTVCLACLSGYALMADGSCQLYPAITASFSTTAGFLTSFSSTLGSTFNFSVPNIVNTKYALITINVTSSVTSFQAKTVSGAPAIGSRALLNSTTILQGTTRLSSSSSSTVSVVVNLTVGTTTFNMSAYDTNGLTTKIVVQALVLDVDFPKVTCPANYMFTTDPTKGFGTYAYPKTLTAQQASDNVGIVATSCAAIDTSNNLFYVDKFSNCTGFPIVCSARDAAGNNASCIYNITVCDDEPPSITCPGDILLNISKSLNYTTRKYSAVVTDNVGASYVCTPNAVGTAINWYQGVIVGNCTATDGANYSSSCSFLITTIDIYPPNLKCPLTSSVSLNTTGATAAVFFSTITSTDNTYLPVKTLCNFGYPNSINLPIGKYNATCNSTDVNNNTAYCSIPVTVIDKTTPKLTCPAIIIDNTDPGLNTSLIAYSYSVFDNVNVSTVVCEPPSGTAYAIGTTRTKCTATDTSGNNGTCAFYVTVSDDEAPTVTCPNNTLIKSNTTQNIVVPIGQGTARDNVQVNFTTTTVSTLVGTSGLLAANASTFTYSAYGPATFTFSATDTSDLVGFCSWTVTVIAPNTVPDTTPPVIYNCPTNVTYGLPNPDVKSYPNTTYTLRSSTVLNQAYAIVTWPTMNATDNSGYVTSGYFDWSLTPGGLALIGSHLVGYEAIDNQGNVAVCVFIVNVVDTQPPRFANCPGNLTAFTGAQSRSAYLNSWPAGGIQAIDNVEILTPYGVCSSSPSDLCPLDGKGPTNLFDVGTYVFTYTALDSSYNYATPCVFSFTVIDDAPPLLQGCPTSAITVPTSPGSNTGDITGLCPTFTYSDNVGIASAVYTSQPAGYDCVTSTSIPITDNLVITFAVADQAGHVVSCSFFVRVLDSEPPTFNNCDNETSPSLWSLSASGSAASSSCSASISLPNITSSDNSGTTVQSLFSIPVGLTLHSAFPVGISLLILTAQDLSFRSASCRVAITVTDSDPPRIFNCPSSGSSIYTYSIPTSPGLASAYFTIPNITASDNCALSTVTYHPSAYHSLGNFSFPISAGTTSILFTAQDSSLNIATCEFNVAVVDNEPPKLVNCPLGDAATPGVYTRATDAGRPGATVTLPTVTATDNVGVRDITVKSVPDGFATALSFSVGNCTITYTARDLAGNSVSCAVTIVILDLEPPVIVTPDNFQVAIASPNVPSTFVTWRSLFAVDNFFVKNTAADLSPGNYSVGTYRVQWYAWDYSGNNASASFNFTVVAYAGVQADASSSSSATAAIGGAGGGVAVIFVIFVVFFIIVRRRHKKRLAVAASGYAELLAMSDEFILERARNIQTSLMAQRQAAPPVLEETEFIHPERKFAPPPNTVDELEVYMRETVGKEIARDDVELGAELGSGEFGAVFEGFYTGGAYKGDSKLKVAVKLLKGGDESSDSKARFLKEAAIMAQFSHPNIVALIGVCTLPKTEPTLIVLEYMHLGSLHGYLQSPMVKGILQNVTMVRMALDVAAGMQYLSEAGFVHRDLAARNVLIDKNMVCHIADFGLSVDASTEEDNGIYAGQEGAKIPIRWTSLEAINLHQFSSASDVWSFGVVLWEMWSYAALPYAGWNNRKVIEQVSLGYRLPRPEDCPYDVYRIMIECWNKNVARRSTFHSLRKSLIEVWKDLAGEETEGGHALYDNTEQQVSPDEDEEEFGFGAAAGAGGEAFYDTGIEESAEERKPQRKSATPALYDTGMDDDESTLISQAGPKSQSFGQPPSSSSLFGKQYFPASTVSMQRSRADGATALATPNPIYDGSTLGASPQEMITRMNKGNTLMKSDGGYVDMDTEEQEN